MLILVGGLALSCLALPTSADLYHVILAFGCRYASYADPSSIAAYTACCLIPLDKNLGGCSIKSGEVLQRIIRGERMISDPEYRAERRLEEQKMMEGLQRKVVHKLKLSSAVDLLTAQMDVLAQGDSTSTTVLYMT